MATTQRVPAARGGRTVFHEFGLYRRLGTEELGDRERSLREKGPFSVKNPMRELALSQASAGVSWGQLQLCCPHPTLPRTIRTLDHRSSKARHRQWRGCPGSHRTSSGCSGPSAGRPGSNRCTAQLEGRGNGARGCARAGHAPWRSGESRTRQARWWQRTAHCSMAMARSGRQLQDGVACSVHRARVGCACPATRTCFEGRAPCQPGSDVISSAGTAAEPKHTKHANTAATPTAAVTDFIATG